MTSYISKYQKLFPHFMTPLSTAVRHAEFSCVDQGYMLVIYLERCLIFTNLDSSSVGEYFCH